ncbi:hypothetical protein A3K64_00520 [Candidatus Micrarchaeota archaeon RBG_16_36_9]|nr:MAG: hypothetical protein A3K64_00520 [Candidatus Micrarchaeota archaeon RBG_16_36_9]
MKKYIIPFAVLIATLSVVFFIQSSYDPKKKNNQYEFSSTDFIEPDENFIKCYENTDCIKIKGSACPPSAGGVETCVDKNYFQEYISQITNQAGNEADLVCPQVYLVTNRTCGCIENKCVII